MSKVSQEISVAEQPQQIVEVIKETNVSLSRANQLWEKFRPYYEEFQSIIETAESLCVDGMPTDEQIKLAKETRLKMVKVRNNFDKERADEKQQSLLEGRAIQGFWNIYKLNSHNWESKLKDVEDYHKRIKEAEEARITAERNEKIAPYAEYIPQGVFPGKMTEGGFQDLYELCKDKHEKAIEEEQRLEKQRIEREKKETEEREAQRKENERLKKEAAEREKKDKMANARLESLVKIGVSLSIQDCRDMDDKTWNSFYEKKNNEFQAEQNKLSIERMKQEKENKAAKDREIKALKEKEKAEAALKAKQEAEEKKRKEKEEAERKKAAAPDKEKLLTLAKEIEGYDLPELKTPEANKILSDVKTLLFKVSNHIREKSTSL